VVGALSKWAIGGMSSCFGNSLWKASGEGPDDGSSLQLALESYSKRHPAVVNRAV
jgi:hypothetical protein